MIDPTDVPVAHVEWQPCYRLVLAKFAVAGWFDTIAVVEEVDTVLAVQALTDERARNELGDIRLVPAAERIVGPGSTPIMTAFTHLNPQGSRFSRGQFGVYYCADSRDGAIAEVIYHRATFLRETKEPAVDIDMTLITATLNAHLHDIRAMRSVMPGLYDANSYAASQPFGAQLREQGSWGIVYDSVRLSGAQCAGIFKPRALRDATTAGHIAFHWDGQRITHWYEKGTPLSVPS